MNTSAQWGSGDLVKMLKAVPPQDAAAGAIEGGGIDRSKYLSAALHVAVGAASGTPDSFSVTAKVQHSSDDASADPYADYIGPESANVEDITAIVADNGQTQLNINLSKAKKYVRAVVTVAFVSGSTPKIEVAATWAFGGAETLPAS